MLFGSDGRFGKYTILRRLGRGGMAEVYEVELRADADFAKRLALKVLIPDSKPDPQLARSFIDEANIAARLSHPNIVEVYDFGEQDGVLYIAMELVAGWDLRQVTQLCARAEVLLPTAASVYVMHEVARALEYIHEHDPPIIHRDVSPHNIFVTHEGHIKLGDFGIAKTAERLTHTLSGQIKGKLSYIAPEQIAGEAASVRSDVYGAGLVLFELLTGRKLLAGESEVELLRLAQNPPQIAPSSLNPLAARLDELTRRTLERHPTMRLRSAALMAERLEGFLAEAPCNARGLAGLLEQLDQGNLGERTVTTSAGLELVRRPQSHAAQASGATLPVTPAWTPPGAQTASPVRRAAVASQVPTVDLGPDARRIVEAAASQVPTLDLGADAKRIVEAAASQVPTVDLGADAKRIFEDEAPTRPAAARESAHGRPAAAPAVMAQGAAPLALGSTRSAELAIRSRRLPIVLFALVGLLAVAGLVWLGSLLAARTTGNETAAETPLPQTPRPRQPVATPLAVDAPSPSLKTRSPVASPPIIDAKTPIARAGDAGTPADAASPSVAAAKHRRPRRHPRRRPLRRERDEPIVVRDDPLPSPPRPVAATKQPALPKPRVATPTIITTPPPKPATTPPAKPVIDRAHARRELARLEAQLARTTLPAADRQRVEKASQRILRLIMGDRPREACRLIDAQLRFLSRRGGR